ncbi:MAG: choline dehydrogenase [Chloroflexi bacterium]|nr:choline dehydrogenase [Chloroflexota bacterium]
MARLSSSIVDIKDHYQIIVIGSGYGGSIAASRLARAGQQVCLLERGKEIQPGEYPDTESETTQETQFNLPSMHMGSHTALNHYHINDDMTVLVGCGLGGTSLINANAALRVDPRIFNDSWPEAFRNDVDTLLADGYDRAEEMLKPIPYPKKQFPKLLKLEALKKSAKAMNATCYRVPLNITFKDGVNHVGVEQKKCKLCGDCMAGCNYRAKNTTLMNYLPDARNHGAEIFTEASVRYIERQNNRWVVHYQVLDSGAEKFDAPTLTVSANIVVLAAGTLGSTEILLRSKAEGLPLSNILGMRFSGNGDVGGFAYNTDQAINAIGTGQRADEMEPVGPTITGVIDTRDDPSVEDGMVIQEGALHSPIAVVLPQALVAMAKTVGKDTDSGLADFVAEKKRELDSLVRGPYHGAMRNTQTWLVMTHDDSGGRLCLEDDRIRISWPGVGEQPFVKKVNDQLEKGTRALGGTFVANPLWSTLPAHNMVTAHPIGGCVMAEDANQGVVNHKGQVFAGASGTDVYEGLYVCDGAVIPRSIGVNLLLTISAISERCMALLAQDRKWKIDYNLPSAPMKPPESELLGLQFTETMGGYFSSKIKDDFTRGAQQGKDDDSSFKFILTVLANDLEQMMTDPDYTAYMIGTVTVPALSPEPLMVTEGEFNLFMIDPNDPAGLRRMKYRMKMTTEDGKVYYFVGFKLVRDDPGLDLWSDTTTLYITVHDGDSQASPVLGKGILRIYPEDFRRQMTTVQIKNAQNMQERLGSIARFGRFFSGSLFDIYGGVFARPNLFNPDAPARKKRPLRVSVPEVYLLETKDKVQLRLTRYKGGEKGPVMLVHGLGVSSLAFSIDTIDTNMLEYLFANGYDVWLLDYRASIELPYATTQHTADDIAHYDWPAAVNTVLATTGADSIQTVAHCYGAITFSMAMLAGLQGVRSAVCSQVGAHINVIPSNQIKSGLYLGTLLEKLGVKNLTMYTDAHDNWLDHLYNKALNLYPIAAEERCNSPVCHRVTFLYAPLYEHDQLNNATHNVLHELFGVASISNFRHVETLTQKGHLVDVESKETYLPHVERMAIPISFIHGAENETWTPESTERTYNWLREHNGKGLYSRYLIPNYGHIDCIFGKNAVKDVYPFILQHLEATG